MRDGVEWPSPRYLRADWLAKRPDEFGKLDIPGCEGSLPIYPIIDTTVLLTLPQDSGQFKLDVPIYLPGWSSLQGSLFGGCWEGLAWMRAEEPWNW